MNISQSINDSSRGRLLRAAMVAAAADGSGGGDGSGRQVKPAHQGTLTPGKDRKRKSKQRDRTRSESLSPDSVVTSTAGVDVGMDQKLMTTATAASSHGGMVELQQQTNGKKPRLVWTPELHERFVKACKKLEETGAKILAQNSFFFFFIHQRLYKHFCAAY